MEAAQSVSLFAGVRHFPSPRRGGQPGNRNRLRHGGFSTAAYARRDSVRALIRKLNRLIVIARSMHATKSYPPLEGGSKNLKRSEGFFGEGSTSHTEASPLPEIRFPREKCGGANFDPPSRGGLI